MCERETYDVKNAHAGSRECVRARTRERARECRTERPRERERKRVCV